MKTWLLVIFGALAVLIVAVLVIGWLLPRNHQASRSVVVDQPPEAIWSVITDYAAAPEWRKDIASVRREERDGQTVWVEVSQNGDEIGYVTVESREPEHLVRRIVGDDLPFGGDWTFEIEPAAAGSKVTITETGYVDNPIFRFVSVVFIGHTRFMDQYLRFLGERFGQTVTPTDA